EPHGGYATKALTYLLGTDQGFEVHRVGVLRSSLDCAQRSNPNPIASIRTSFYDFLRFCPDATSRRICRSVTPNTRAMISSARVDEWPLSIATSWASYRMRLNRFLWDSRFGLANSARAARSLISCARSNNCQSAIPSPARARAHVSSIQVAV